MQPKRILLVDDEARLLSALRRRLSDDFDIKTATSGAEALQIIEGDDAIAVVVADMQMPGMNGVDLLKIVREKAPAIRRIMLTGNADLETAMAAINDGKVMRFLRKPCDAAELKAVLSQGLEEFEFQTSQADEAPSDANAPDVAEAARTAFLSMMNHELRTPLNQILGFAQLLESQPLSANEPESFSHLRQIRESGERMLMLVNRILDFSRLKSVKDDQCNGEGADIVEILNDQIERIRNKASAKKITISFDSLRKHAEINARDADIRLAIWELLDNAVKFSAVGGHISVLVRCKKSNVWIKIVDSGCGVQTAQIERLRQPFRQGNESLSRPFEGIGLGLALVATIMEINNATFSLAPSVGGGTAATLVFNRALSGGGREETGRLKHV